MFLVTELTMNYHAARFISSFGSKEYFRHNKGLLFNERRKTLIEEIDKLTTREDIEANGSKYP